MKLPVHLYLLPFLVVPAVLADSNRAAVVERLRGDIEFFADDAQQGRGVGSEGIERSAQRIIREYERIGLKPAMSDGSWRQTFDIKIGAVGHSPQTHVTLNNATGVRHNLTLDHDCQPLMRGGEGVAGDSLVFVGYGITAPEFGWDDYAELDVQGKTLIVIRRVPGMGNPDAPFSGESISPHAYIDTKLRLAKEHNAAAVLFVNDPYSEPDSAAEELASIEGFGLRGPGVPFIQVRQRVIDDVLELHPLKTEDGTFVRTLKDAAEHIDRTLAPLSRELDSWSSDIEVKFTGETVKASNLIGMVEGQGPHSEETIIIGGHYDHIGFGEYGSRARSRRGEVHNGADDNASGTAAVLELARRISAGPAPARRIVFICFSGEERGLLGSNHYVRHPVFPLDDTVFMFNFDMVGSLRNNRVEVNGVGTAAEFFPLVQQADEDSSLDVKLVSSPFGGSDHLPFYRKKIPVMFCFTGVTDRYHTPDDDIETLSMEGIASVLDLSEHIFELVSELPLRPTYRRASRGRKQVAVLGIRPDLSAGDGKGVRVLGVRPASPASSSGIKVGDIVVRIDDQDVSGYAALNDFLQSAGPNRTVAVQLLRNNESLTLQVTLGKASR